MLYLIVPVIPVPHLLLGLLGRMLCTTDSLRFFSFFFSVLRFGGCAFAWSGRGFFGACLWLACSGLTGPLAAAVMAPKKQNVPKVCENEDIKSWVERFGRAGAALERRELSLLFSCLEVCEQSMLDVATEFVQHHGGNAVLMQYSQDCMASKLRQYVSGKGGGLKVRRSGVHTEELLVQNVFLTSEVSPGQYGHCVLFSVPLKCIFGKDGASLAGYSTVQPGLSILPCCPMSFRLRHFVHDRGVPNDVPMFLSSYILEQSKVAASDEEEGEEDESPSYLTELHTSVSCACHDGHNAVKWSALSDFSAEQRMTSIYIACSAMRTGFLKCFGMLSVWISQVLQPVPSHMLPSVEMLKALWTTLQVDDASIEVLLRFRVFWSESRLHIDEGALTSEDWLETLTTLLMSLWRLPPWTASRWLTIGASCRAYTVASLSGFQHMFNFLSESSVGSAYEQAGFEKLDAEARDFMVVTGLVSYTAESFLGSVLSDNRLALNSREVFALCQETHGFLECMPGWVWEQICTVTGNLTASALRSRVVRGSLSSLAYLEHRVFAVLREGPWCYCSGDVSEHVQALKELAPSDCDPVTRKLVIWAHAGIADEKLEEVLKLLSQASFSSHFAERQHSSSAQMKRFHDYGYETLAARSFMHSYRQLLVIDDPRARDVLRLQNELRSLLAKQPQKTGPKQMYMAEMVAKGKALRARGKLAESNVAQITAMKHHSKHYEALSEDQKRKFEEQALVHRSSSSVNINKRARVVEDRLDEAEELQHASSRRNESSMLLSNCRLSSSQSC
eukprot:6491674-Amphidinium_carterae.5